MSTVIKATDRDRGIHQAAFNFDDLRAEAQRQLDEIRAQAAKIVTDARAQADNVRKQAFAEGQQKAQQQLSERAAEEAGRRLQTLFPAIQAAIGQIQIAQQAIIADWEGRIVELACAIAERVIRREVSQRPQITLDLVREGLQLAAGAPQVRLRINPADHAQLGLQLTALAAEFSRLGPTEIMADSTIEAGSCRIETAHGTIDQQFGAQLARIAMELS